MKILYDLFHSQPIGGSKFHGGGEYIKTVFRYLVQNFSQTHTICAFYDKDRFLDDWLKKLIKKYNIHAFDVKSVSEVFSILKDGQFDTFYSGLAYGYDNIGSTDNVHMIGTIHGLRSLEKPQDDYSLYYISGNIAKKVKEHIKYHIRKRAYNELQNKEIDRYRSAISHFHTIVTDSYHSEFAFQCWFPDTIKNVNLKTFYAPEKYTDFGLEFVRPEGTPEKYILLLGGNRWLKNVPRSIIALEGLFDNGLLEDYSVVICGRLPLKINSFIRHRERYCLLDYVSPGELEYLYKNCAFFVYLSLNEGFGMPPLEAMNYGKTVVTSPVCSIPEICGNAVYYANPYDIKEIQNRILQAHTVKIKEDTIHQRLEYIQDKQKKDLHALCELIVSGGVKK